MTQDLEAALRRATAGFALLTEGCPKPYAAYQRLGPFDVLLATITAASWDEARAAFRAGYRAVGLSTDGIFIAPI